MKHPFNPTCDCKRCAREHGRRLQQAKAETQRQFLAGTLFTPKPARRRRVRSQTRTLEPGTLAWAEARGGLIGGYEED